MAGKEVKGFIIPTFTVFDEEKEIDYESTMKHANFMIEKGAESLLILGSTQEMAVLTEEEYRTLVKEYLDNFGDRIPITVGVVSPSTKTAVARAEYAEAAGADAVFAGEAQPGMSHEAIIKYHETVSGAVGIPYGVYNNPSDGSSGLSVYEIAEMSQKGFVKMLKDTTGDPARMLELKDLCSDDMKLFYGEDYAAYFALQIGVDGWTSGIANIMPDECFKLWNLMKEKKYDEGLELWKKILPIANMTTVGQEAYGLGDACYWLQLYKEGAKYHIGTNAYMRLPEEELPAEDREILHSELKKLGY